MVHFGEFLKTWSLRSNSVTRQVSFLIGQKLVENDKIQKFKCDILSNFQTMCECVKISLFHWFPRLNYFYLLHKKAAKPDIRDIMTCPISQIRDNVLGLWMPSSFQSLTSGSSDPVQMKWRLNFLDLVLYVRLIVITLWKKNHIWNLLESATQCLKITQNVAFEFFNFGIFLSGNTVWPKTSVFQKLAKMDHFWHF